MKSTFNGGIFTFEEKVSETTKGINPVKMVVTAYIYGELRGNNNNLIKDAATKVEKGKFSVSFSKADPPTIFVRYAVSYISPDQAKINFTKEVRTN